MSNFKVGDRVRIVNCKQAQHRQLLGREGTITGSRVHPFDGFLWEVLIDGLPELRADGWRHAYWPTSIEPILRTPDAAEILSMTQLPEGPVREREYVNAR